MISRDGLFLGSLPLPIAPGNYSLPQWQPLEKQWNFTWFLEPEVDRPPWPCSPTFLPMQKYWSLADDSRLCLTTSGNAAFRVCLSSGGSDQWQCGHLLQAPLAPSNHLISSLRFLLTLGLYLLSLGWAKVHVMKKVKALGQFSKLEQPHSLQ